MLNDLTMIVHDLPGRDLTVLPIGDVHLGAAEHMSKEWDEFCRAVTERPDVYLMLGGDLLDNAVKNSPASVYEQVMSPSQAKKRMAEMLEPLAGRILCSVGGNHEHRSVREVDDDPTYDIMCRLGVEQYYRPNTAFVKLRLGERARANGTAKMGFQRPAYTFVVTHGHGSSIYTGGASAKAERHGMAVDNMDCQITFHTHKPMAAPIGKLSIDPRNNKVNRSQWWLVVGSSWLDWTGYAARKLYTPTGSCKQEIKLSAEGKRISVTMGDMVER